MSCGLVSQTHLNPLIPEKKAALGGLFYILINFKNLFYAVAEENYQASNSIPKYNLQPTPYPSFFPFPAFPLVHIMWDGSVPALLLLW